MEMLQGDAMLPGMDDTDYKARVVYLFGEVNEYMASKVVKAINRLNKTKGKITVYLNSPGGCVYSGMAIFDMFRCSKNKITIKVCGIAMSMGAVILQAGHERIITKNSRIMVHVGQTAFGLDHVNNVKKAMEDCEKIDSMVEDIFLEVVKRKKPKMTKVVLHKEMMEFDRYFSAEEALDWGLVDKVI